MQFAGPIEVGIIEHNHLDYQSVAKSNGIFSQNLRAELLGHPGAGGLRGGSHEIAMLQPILPAHRLSLYRYAEPSKV